LFFPTFLTFAWQDKKTTILLPHVNMFKYLVSVNQIKPTWRMCQFMLCTIPSIIQHRIPKFLIFYEFCKFYEDLWKEILE
jgi:hypothetical protein